MATLKTKAILSLDYVVLYRFIQQLNVVRNFQPVNWIAIVCEMYAKGKLMYIDRKVRVSNHI